jgi:hypothetical protein
VLRTIALVSALSGAATAQQSIAITGVTVVDPAAGKLLPGRTVITEGDSILWVGRAADARIPPKATRIRGAGKFLLAGLWDMHAHVDTADLTLFLASGVTGVREMNGDSVRLRMKREVARGSRAGPRLFVSSPLLAGVRQRYRHIIVPSPDSARVLAKKLRDDGYDFLKAYDGLSVETYDALADAAVKLGVPLVGHLPAGVDVPYSIVRQQRSIEHVEQIMRATTKHPPDTAAIPAIVEALRVQNQTWVTPTLAVSLALSWTRTPWYADQLRRDEMRFVDDETLGWWTGLAGAAGGGTTTYQRLPPPSDNAFSLWSRVLVRELDRAEVPLLAGTDSPNPLMVPGVSLLDELDALVDAGLTRARALRMATSDAARFLGLNGKAGQVSKGAFADAVLLDANPLENLVALRRPAGVMSAGRWHDRAELDRWLATATKRTPK